MWLSNSQRKIQRSVSSHPTKSWDDSLALRASRFLVSSILKGVQVMRSLKPFSCNIALHSVCKFIYVSFQLLHLFAVEQYGVAVYLLWCVCVSLSACVFFCLSCRIAKPMAIKFPKEMMISTANFTTTYQILRKWQRTEAVNYQQTGNDFLYNNRRNVTTKKCY